MSIISMYFSLLYNRLWEAPYILLKILIILPYSVRYKQHGSSFEGQTRIREHVIRYILMAGLFGRWYRLGFLSMSLPVGIWIREALFCRCLDIRSFFSTHSYALDCVFLQFRTTSRFSTKPVPFYSSRLFSFVFFFILSLLLLEAGWEWTARVIHALSFSPSIWFFLFF